jgi:hypothetical protein
MKISEILRNTFTVRMIFRGAGIQGHLCRAALPEVLCGIGLNGPSKHWKEGNPNNISFIWPKTFYDFDYSDLPRKTTRQEASGKGRRSAFRN